MVSNKGFFGCLWSGRQQHSWQLCTEPTSQTCGEQACGGYSSSAQALTVSTFVVCLFVYKTRKLHGPYTVIQNKKKLQQVDRRMKTCTIFFCLFNIIVIFFFSNFSYQVHKPEVFSKTFPILRSNGAKYASYQVSAKHCMHFKLISKSEPWFFEAEYSFYYYHIL